MIITWFEKHNFVSWLITIFGAGLVFYISSLSFSGESQNFGNVLPLIYHFFAFFLLCFFLLISFNKGKWDKRKFIFGVILVLLYAVSDEIHQIFVSNRDASYLDFIIDSLGIFFSGLIYYKRLR